MNLAGPASERRSATHKLILDVMGGDRAPHVPLEGAALALPELSRRNAELILLGDEAKIRPLLSRRRLKPLNDALNHPHREGIRVTLCQTTEAIEMDDSIHALRTKPNATLNLGCELAAEAYRTHSQDPSQPCSAFISAGHSGAMMVSSLRHMGRLKGVERPAIAVKLPTLNPNGCVLLDVGANVDCRASHLRDFAIMGALFAQVEQRVSRLPRVGLLSNGEESCKGNELTRQALELIGKLECLAEGPARIGEFVGYSEGKDLFRGQVDVMVTDGFVGNVVLKTTEGLGSAVITLLKREARSSLLTPLGFLLAATAFKRLRRKLDYAEYGAAPLLGVAGYAFICHGRSNPRAIKNALIRAHSAQEQRLVQRLEDALRSSSRG